MGLSLIENGLSSALVVLLIFEVVIFWGSLEYLIIVINFFTRRLFKLDLEVTLKDELFKGRYAIQHNTFMLGSHILRLTVEVEINDPHASNRITTFIYTHAGFFDSLLTLCYVPQRCYFIAKDFFAKVPLVGACFLKSGHIQIDRQDLQAAIGALDIAARKMRQEGKSIGISPEGTRRRIPSIDSGEHLLTFKKGPFHMAKKAESDMVMVTFQGVKRLSADLFYKPGTIRMKIGSRIDKEEVARLSAKELSDKARAAMIQQLQPPMTDEEVFKVTKSRLPMLAFCLVQVVFYFITRKALCLLFR